MVTLFPLNIGRTPRVVRQVRMFTALVSLFPVDLKSCLFWRCHWLLLVATIRNWLLRSWHNTQEYQSTAEITAGHKDLVYLPLCVRKVCLKWVSGTVWLCIQITLETLMICCFTVSQKSCPSGCCKDISFQMSGSGNKRSFSIRNSNKIKAVAEVFLLYTC